MRGVGYALACAALCVSALISAQGTSAQLKTVQLSRVIINPEIPAANQRVKVGTVCLFAGRPLNFGSGERTLNYERFERLFSATMSERRFSVIARSSNLFEGEGNSPGPDFLVGATIRPQSVNICDSVSGQKGTIAISVEWQIYDRGTHQVVERTTTEGVGEVSTFQADGLNVMIDRAFSASLTALIDQGVIQRHVGSPTS